MDITEILHNRRYRSTYKACTPQQSAILSSALVSGSPIFGPFEMSRGYSLSQED